MTDSYQEQARMFCMNDSDNLAYPLFGLYEETAELIEKTPIEYAKGWNGLKAKIVLKLLTFIGIRLGKWAKRIRKGQTECPFDLNHYAYDNRKKECLYELGDMHWMVANLDSNYWFRSEDVEKANIEKLENRKKSNTICEHTDH